MRHKYMLAAVLALSLLASAAFGEKPAIHDFLGLCGHTILFRPALYAPMCTLVRDYHPVDWDLGEHTEQLPDWPFAKNQVNWDAVYRAWQNKGFRTNVCLQFDAIPPPQWHDFAKDAAAYAGTFARHFGPSAKSPLVEAIEIGNEPGRYSDAQYTTLLRTVALAFRAADPKLRIATCNLTTGRSTEYAKSVETLVADPRVLPAVDVLTIHTYAEAEPYPTWRRSFPEDPNIKYLKDVQALGAWRDRHAPDKPIWITEFGYDATTKKPDPRSEFARWMGVSEMEQAQYLVRSVLIFAALPVERAYLYWFNDSDEPKLHGSSGLTRNFQPKPACFALVHLQKTLGNYRFSRVVEQKPGEVYAYEFSSANNSRKRIIAMWSPTGRGRTGKVHLNLPAGFEITSAEEMPIDSRRPTVLQISSAADIPVTERPLYLHLIRVPEERNLP
jgi:hypothetical protein